MKFILRYIVFLFVVLLFSFCNNAVNSPEATQMVENEIFKNELYSINGESISLEWTAYKFSDKIAVSGTFNDFTIHKKIESGSVEKILTKLNVSIPTDSVDARNAIRDFKLRSSFFETFNTSLITGTIVYVKDGEGIVKLKMNNISVNTPFTYSFQNDTISMFAHLDLKRWKGEGAINRIENECVEHLKGADGISKLWLDIDVVVKLPVIKAKLND